MDAQREFTGDISMTCSNLLPRLSNHETDLRVPEAIRLPIAMLRSLRAFWMILWMLMLLSMLLLLAYPRGSGRHAV